MSTPRVLRRLYSLDTSSPDFLRYLYSLIQADDEEQYLINLQEPALSRLVDFLDGVRTFLWPLYGLQNGLRRSSISP